MARDTPMRYIASVPLRWVNLLYAWMLDEKRSLYGLAAARILVGVAVLGILLSNFRFRHVLWGPGSFWAVPLRDESEFGALLSIFEGDSTTAFTFKYVLLMIIAAAFLIGWRTRLMNLLLVLGMTGLVERADLIGDQGDNIIRIGLTLMLFMSTAEHWSLDARRRAQGRQRTDQGAVWKRLWYGLPILPPWWTALIHNVALVGLACQIFILYTASALYKVQGTLWQDGTALYYPLSVNEYGIFPWLNQLLVADPTVLTLMTYFSVYVQLFFAVGLLHPVTRRLAIIGVISLHGGIAVLMGLPWFSLAMLAFDAIFVTDRSWRWVERQVKALMRWVRGRLSRGGAKPGTDQVQPGGAEAKSRGRGRGGATIAERRAGFGRPAEEHQDG